MSRIPGQPSVAVIVLNWNGRTETLACLESLSRSDWPSLTTIVVDNGSSEDLEPHLSRRFSDVVLVRNGTNLGFAGGMNRGIRTAVELSADYVLLLNNDVEVAPDTVAALVAAAAEHPDAGIVSPLELFRDRRDVISSLGLRCNLNRGWQGPPLGRGEHDDGRFEGTIEVDSSAGTAMLVPMAAVRSVGALDEDLFLYIEDVDFSLRMRAAGYRIYTALEARIWHGGATSSGGEDSPAVKYYHVRNVLTVSARHAPLRGARGVVRELEVVILNFLHALRNPQRSAGIRAVFDGWRDYRRGRLGPWSTEAAAQTRQGGSVRGEAGSVR